MNPNITGWLWRMLRGISWLYSLGLVLYLALRVFLRDATWWLALLHTFAFYLFLPLVIMLPLALLLGRRSKNITLILVNVVLALVAVFWFVRPALTHTTSAAADAPVFKLITFNAWGHNPYLATTVTDWLVEQDADLVVLQEIRTAGPDPRLERLRRVYPYTSIIDGSTRVLSQRPFVEEEIVVLEDYPPGRLANRVVVQFAGRPLVIYGIHMSLPRGDHSHVNLPLYQFPFSMFLNYDETRRNGQIDRLLGLVADETTPVITAGDFNMSDTSLAYDKLAATLTDSYRAAGHGLGFSWPVTAAVELPASIPPLLRIDYVWHDSALRTIDARLGPQLGSDHLPVIVTLAWGD